MEKSKYQEKLNNCFSGMKWKNQNNMYHLLNDFSWHFLVLKTFAINWIIIFYDYKRNYGLKSFKSSASI